MAIVSPRATAKEYPAPQTTMYGDWTALLERGDFQAFARGLIEWILSISHAVTGIINGKTNNHGLVTLAISAATTTIADQNIGPDTKVILTPQSANAAAEWVAGSLYVTHPNVTEGQAVINHVNSATTARDFSYVLIG